MLSLQELYEITKFDNITIPFSEKINNGKVYYRTVTGNWINLTGKQYREDKKFHDYLRRNLVADFHLVRQTKKVSFYRNSEDDYFELKNGNLLQISEKTYKQRVKWIEQKAKKR